MIDGEFDTQGWNRYSYVRNNPIMYKDPTGHWKDQSEGTSYTDKNDDTHLTVLHKGEVEKGDTLYGISKHQLEQEIGKKNVTNKLINERVNAVKAVNNLKDNNIKPGQKLVVGITDKNIGKEGLSAPPFDPILDTALLLAGGGVTKKAAQESLSKVTADTVVKQGAKQLALRESGKFAEHTTSNLVKGLLKAADNETRALAAKELYYKFGATKTAAALATGAEIYSGTSPAPPANLKQTIGWGLNEAKTFYEEKLKEK